MTTSTVLYTVCAVAVAVRAETMAIEVRILSDISERAEAVKKKKLRKEMKLRL